MPARGNALETGAHTRPQRGRGGPGAVGLRGGERPRTAGRSGGRGGEAALHDGAQGAARARGGREGGLCDVRDRAPARARGRGVGPRGREAVIGPRAPAPGDGALGHDRGLEAAGALELVPEVGGRVRRVGLGGRVPRGPRGPGGGPGVPAADLRGQRPAAPHPRRRGALGRRDAAGARVGLGAGVAGRPAALRQRVDERQGPQGAARARQPLERPIAAGEGDGPVHGHRRGRPQQLQVLLLRPVRPRLLVPLADAALDEGRLQHLRRAGPRGAVGAEQRVHKAPQRGAEAVRQALVVAGAGLGGGARRRVASEWVSSRAQPVQQDPQRPHVRLGAQLLVQRVGVAGGRARAPRGRGPAVGVLQHVRCAEVA